MTALDHVGLSVGDLDAQAQWYAQALGLSVANRFEMHGIGLRGLFVVHESGWALELLEREGSSVARFAADHNEALLTRGYGHVCLRVADVDAIHAQLIAAGAAPRLAPRDAPEPGVRMAFVADPEGNLIELLDRAGPVRP